MQQTDSTKASTTAQFVQLLWLITAVGLWIAAIAGPLMLVFVVYITMTAPATINLHGVPASVPGVKAIYVAAPAFIVALGLSYVLFFRKRAFTKSAIRHGYIIILFLILPLLMSTAEAYCYKSALRSMSIVSLTVTGYDADTKEPLESFAVQMPSPGQDWFPCDSQVAFLEPNRLSLICISIEPVKIEFSADGYKPRTIEATHRSSSMDLYLEKETE
jgi:hypothetical protein